MKSTWITQRSLVASISAALVCLLCAGVALAGDVEEGFVSLFNGKDLTGWAGGVDGYTVEDGVIQFIPGESGRYMYTEKEYSDFVFRFEFQLTENANNGLAVRAPAEGNAAYAGMELQILDDNGPRYNDENAEKYLKLKPYQHHGSVYGVIPAKTGFLKPTGEWNVQEVTAKGTHIKVVLNGETILDGDLKEASKNGTMDGKEHPGLLNEKGHIGFLGHGDPVAFRNIRIKEL